jgi:hypothetical protein
VASVAPYDEPYARLTPGLLNDSSEIEETLEAIHDLG